MRNRNEEEGDSEDQIKPEDGLVRYWMFLNGEQFRLFSALAAALFGVSWCFLCVLGAGQSLVGVVLGVLAIICLVSWRVLDVELRGVCREQLGKRRALTKARQN